MGAAGAVLLQGAAVAETLPTVAALTGLGAGMGAAVGVRAAGKGTRPRSATFAAVGAALGALARLLLDT